MWLECNPSSSSFLLIPLASLSLTPSLTLGGDCFLLESIFEAEVWSFMCDPVSEANEAAVCAAMVEGAREALAGYCSSIEEDLALLRGGSSSSRQELAVQVGEMVGGCVYGGV